MQLIQHCTLSVAQVRCAEVTPRTCQTSGLKKIVVVFETTTIFCFEELGGCSRISG